MVLYVYKKNFYIIEDKYENILVYLNFYIYGGVIMKKISFTILMCLIISNIFPTYINADDLQNSKDQLSQVSSKLSELNNELKQTEKQIFSLNESIGHLIVGSLDG